MGQLHRTLHTVSHNTMSVPSLRPRMQSSVLPEHLNRPTTTMDGRSGDSSDVVVVGELYFHGSPTPV
jgi:hypothetical protein